MLAAKRRFQIFFGHPIRICFQQQIKFVTDLRVVVKMLSSGQKKVVSGASPVILIVWIVADVE